MTDKTDISREYCEGVITDCHEMQQWFTDKSSEHNLLFTCVSLINALRDALDAAQSERVKPLEWRGQAGEVEHWGTGPFTCLRIINWNKIDNYPDRNYFEYCGEQYAELDDAKEAAQADYERRILSALQPALEPTQWDHHAYSPSIMHMGDCSVCGNVRDHPNHEPAPAPSEWNVAIEAAPPSEPFAPHIRGVWVHNNRLDSWHWESHLGWLHDETGDFIDPETSEDFGWHPDDYSHWMKLPEPPKRPDKGDGV